MVGSSSAVAHLSPELREAVAAEVAMQLGLEDARRRTEAARRSSWRLMWVMYAIIAISVQVTLAIVIFGIARR